MIHKPDIFCYGMNTVVEVERFFSNEGEGVGLALAEDIAVGVKAYRHTFGQRGSDAEWFSTGSECDKVTEGLIMH